MSAQKELVTKKAREGEKFAQGLFRAARPCPAAGVN